MDHEGEKGVRSKCGVWGRIKKNNADDDDDSRYHDDDNRYHDDDNRYHDDDNRYHDDDNRYHDDDSRYHDGIVCSSMQYDPLCDDLCIALVIFPRERDQDCIA